MSRSEHPAGLAHHFDDLDQQHAASSLGMWVFLVTEIMFFGGLFLGYTIYRAQYPQAFADASHHLDVFLGGVNTVILIASSLTMALSVYSAQTSNRKALIAFLILTLILGCAFLGIKAYEYHHKYEENLIPGPRFVYDGDSPRQAELFFSFYFAMTGMHAVHMIVGAGLLSVLIYMAWKGRFTAEHYAPVDVTGLYWHFVDIIWIFLFPLLYLIGLHQ